MEVEIKITVTIDGKESQMTMDEAENLYNELGRVFNKPTTLTVPDYVPGQIYPRNPWDITYTTGAMINNNKGVI